MREEDEMADGLIRDVAGRYHTTDGRFEVEHEGTSWYLRDLRQLDELGLPRVLGPFATLDAVREAVSSAPAAPPRRGKRASR